MPRRSKEHFEEVVTGIKPLTLTILNQLPDPGPETVTLEFGIKFSVNAGVVPASAASEGHCKITLGWKKLPAA